MGRVADAYDRSLDRAVAIKTIHTTSATDLARFEREAQVTARLEHPGIVPIYDAGRDEQGRPYYVMRKVDGRPLDKLVAETNDLDARLALVPNLLTACDAVGFAHARGVMHRDLKPTNILVGAFGETLVIDWGLARAIDDQAPDGPGGIPSSGQNLTQVGTVAGTPGFMSPEQARGEVVDARADVYALGATLFYVLAGALPFATDSATEMVELAGANRQADWTRLPAAVPADLVAIVRKALAPDDDDRYVDAGAMANDLRRFVTGKVVGAHRYGVGEQVRRFVQRNRAAVAIAAIAFLVISVGGVLSVRRVLAERDDARRARALSERAAREATARNDEYMIQHAFDLLDADPLQTIAVLRQLRPESSQWPAAASAAAAAFSRGLPSGFSFDTRLRNYAFSPSGTLLLVRDDEDATWLVDLRARTRRQLAGRLAGEDLDWLDRQRWLVAKIPTGIQLVDITSGARHVIESSPDVQLETARDGSAYVLTRARSVHRLDARSQDLGPAILEEVDQMTAVVGHGLVVVRAGRIYLLRAGSLVELPGTYRAAPDTLLQRAGDAVLAHLDDQTCLWEFGAEIEQKECWAGLHVLAGTARGDGLLEHQAGLIWSFRNGTAAPLRAASIRMATQRNQHYIVLLDDGGIWVRDAGRWLDIGRRGSGLSRALVSDGGEWLAADSPSGDLFIFDLAALRPVRYAATASTNIAALTDTEILITDSEDGLVRIDRATGAREVVVPGPVLSAEMSASGRWGTTPGSTHSNLIDVVNRRIVEVEAGHVVLEKTDPPYALDEDGGLFRYSSGSPEHVTELGAGLRTAHCVEDVAAVVLENQRLCKFQLSSGHVRCIGVPVQPDFSVAEETGTVWAASATEIYRWDGITLLRFSLERPVHSLMRTDHYIAGVGGASVAVIDRSTLTLREHPAPYMRLAVPTAGDQLFVALQKSTLGAFDLASGRSYIRAPSVLIEHALFVTPTSYAVLRTVTKRDRTLDVFSHAVPHEPAALRRWLRDVTNMREVPGSEVVRWP